MGEHYNNLTTLCYIEQDDKYLMLHRVKKQQDVNQDKWIGVGGHFEPGESPEECLLREVREETGLTLTDWRFRGIVTFTYRTPEAYQQELHHEVQYGKSGKVVTDGIVQADMEYMCLYTAAGYEGELTECEEGHLEWVKQSDVYQLPIWEGDKIFFHLLEERETFFSLKLDYIGDDLVYAELDGKPYERKS
jgi:8-oxo-dGTP diphosphatase